MRCVRDKEPVKRVARDLGISKNTIKKYIESNEPPRTAIPSARKSRMATFENAVDQLLRETPAITASRIFAVIRDRGNPDFRLSESSVRKYVASRRRRLVPKESFVRQVYAPGDQVQFDFKDVVARIGGIETKLHLFSSRLSYSTAIQARCFHTEDRPALFDGILRSCEKFGGIAREGVFDNASTAVTCVLRGRARTLNPEFAEFSGSLVLPMEFAAPAKGNEKGGVEGLHGYIEDNFFRPMPDFASLDDLNANLARFCERDMQRKVGGECVADRFEREAKALRPLPTVLPQPCIREYARVNKFSEMQYKTNRYSVPSRFAHRNAVIEVFSDRLRMVVDDEVAAEHSRCFGRNQAILEPLHFMEVLSRKHRAVERAEVFNNPRFHESLRALLHRYVAHERLTAGKQFMRVIALLDEHRMEALVHAVETAAMKGTDDPAAIALLLQQKAHPYRTVAPLNLCESARGSMRPVVALHAYTLSSLKEYA